MTAALPVRSVRSLGLAPAARGEDWVLVGQDGGQSIDLGDEVLFVFADTLLALVPPGGRLPPREGLVLTREQGLFLGNCAARTRGTDLRRALAELAYHGDDHGRPREVLVPTPAERLLGVRLWPQHGLALDGKVYLFYMAIQQLDPGTWNFQPAGSGLAELDPATGASERLRFDGDWRLWPGMGPGFHAGVQVLRQGETVYVFSSLRQGMTCTARLARVATSDLADPAAWEHLASSAPTWTPDPAGGCDLGPCAPELSVSFNPYLEKYLMVYVDGYAKQLCLRAADQPWGPYGPPQPVGALPHRPEAAFISLGFEHPRFARDGGRTVYVTYCQPHFTQNTLVAVTFE